MPWKTFWKIILERKPGFRHSLSCAMPVILQFPAAFRCLKPVFMA